MASSRCGSLTEVFQESCALLTDHIKVEPTPEKELSEEEFNKEDAAKEVSEKSYTSGDGCLAYFKTELDTDVKTYTGQNTNQHCWSPTEVFQESCALLTDHIKVEPTPEKEEEFNKDEDAAKSVGEKTCTIGEDGCLTYLKTELGTDVKTYTGQNTNRSCGSPTEVFQESCALLTDHLKVEPTPEKGLSEEEFNKDEDAAKSVCEKAYTIGKDGCLAYFKTELDVKICTREKLQNTNLGGTVTTQQGNLESPTANTSEKPYTSGKGGYMSELNDEDVKIHTTEQLQGDNQYRAGTTVENQAANSGEKQHACAKCGFRTANRSDLLEHMTVAHGYEKWYMCEKCGFSTADMSTMTQHVKLHLRQGPCKVYLHYFANSKDPYICSECMFSTPDRVSMYQHMKTHTCRTEYTFDSSARQNQSPITYPTVQHTCDKCGYRTLYKDNLSRHMRRHTDEKKYKCELCDYCNAEKRDIDRHKATHTREKPYKCDLCNYCTAQKRNLDRHMAKHTGEKPYMCGECGYRANFKSHLSRHMATHTGVKPRKCDLCNYRTAEKGNLDKHMVTHTGEKPFMCNQCDYCTAQKRNLDRHMAKHTGEKPYMCGECGFRADYRSHLSRHMATHTAVKPRKCDLCNYCTASIEDLVKHRAKHTSDKPYMCGECGFRTDYRSSLSRHMERHLSK